MKLTLSHADLTSVEADLLVVPVLGSDFPKLEVVNQLDAALGGELLRIAKHEDFTGKKGQALTLHTFGKIAAKKLQAGRAFRQGDHQRRVPQRGRQHGPHRQGHQVAGARGAQQRPRAVARVRRGAPARRLPYAEFLTGTRKPKPSAKVTLLVPHRPTASDRKAVDEALAVAEAVNLARDMVNAPPNEMTATKLANEARRVSREHGIRCVVWGKAEIIRHGMTLLTAVNAGSAEEPRFVHMSYVPKVKRKLPKLVFVGKGLTFDSGGLSIKPGKSMETMKCDMAGGAATIAIVMAAARLKLPVEVHGVIASTDNVINGGAFKPGDVYRTLDGKTVEVLNTDAEGRLILADALTYARKLKPTLLVDHATLDRCLHGGARPVARRPVRHQRRGPRPLHRGGQARG